MRVANTATYSSRITSLQKNSPPETTRSQVAMCGASPALLYEHGAASGNCILRGCSRLAVAKRFGPGGSVI